VFSSTPVEVGANRWKSFRESYLENSDSLKSGAQVRAV